MQYKIDEAVEKIRTDSYDSAYCREYIKNKKWTLENQVDEFKSLVEELAQQNAYLKFNDIVTDAGFDIKEMDLMFCEHEKLSRRNLFKRLLISKYFILRDTLILNIKF